MQGPGFPFSISAFWMGVFFDGYTEVLNTAWHRTKRSLDTETGKERKRRGSKSYPDLSLLYLARWTFMLSMLRSFSG